MPACCCLLAGLRALQAGSRLLCASPTVNESFGDEIDKIGKLNRQNGMEGTHEFAVALLIVCHEVFSHVS